MKPSERYGLEIQSIKVKLENLEKNNYYHRNDPETYPIQGLVSEHASKILEEFNKLIYMIDNDKESGLDIISKKI